MKAVAEDFASNATLHGVARLTSEKHIIRRIVWLVIFLAAVGVCLQQIAGLFAKLLNNETQTITSISYKDPIPFPAVTICNMNAMLVYEIQRGASELGTRRGEILRRILRTLNDSINIPNQNDYNEEFLRHQMFLVLMNSLSNEEMTNLTYKMSNILIDCSFEGQKCNASDFTPVRDRYYGRCFVFNAPGHKSNLNNPLLVNASGTINSLQLILYLDEDSYLPVVSPDLGFKVVVHDRDFIPNPHEAGRLVGPGFFTTMAVRLSIIGRLKQPYGKCKDLTPGENKWWNYMLPQLPKTKASGLTCLSTCQQQEMLKLCNCSYHGWAFPEGPAFANVPISVKQTTCNVSDGDKSSVCVKKHLPRLTSTQHACKSQICNFQRCLYNRYDVSQSSTFWPADQAFNGVIEKFKQKGLDEEVTDINNKNISTRAFLKKNLLKLQVYFEDLNVLQISTKPAYTPLLFLADLGGVAGLWLGCSLLSLVEIGELLCNIVMSFGRSVHKKGKQSQISEYPKSLQAPQVQSEINR